MSRQTESSNNTSGKSEEDLIGEDLEKLFALQDKSLSEKKKAILTRALLESGIPIGAMILGVRKLMNEDLNSIKIGIVLAAARSFVDVSEVENRCPHCSSGFVCARDEGGRWFSLACLCGLGHNVKRVNGLRQWGGLKTQTANGRTLIIVGDL